MARCTPTARGVVLSHLEFDLLWDDLSGQTPPYPLEVPSHGVTMAERDALGAKVFATLENAGLTDGEEVAPGLRELVELLNRPTRSVDALVFGEKAWRVLAAGTGERAVLAVLDDNELTLEPARPDRLVAAAMHVIGDLPAGPGEPVRMPREALSAAMEAYARSGYNGFERVLAAAHVTGRAARAVITLVDSERTGAGQAAANGPDGRSPIVSWYDTATGRYAVTVEAVGNELLATLTPADGTWISRRLTELLDQVI